jgi:uncharacterized membrane protein YidH (DUF202 family)
VTGADPARSGAAPEPTLPRERTVLAWQRTALGALALGIGLLRLGVLRGSALQVAAAVAVLLAAAALAVVPLTRGRPDRRRALTPGVAAATTVCVVAAGTLAVAGALLS